VALIHQITPEADLRRKGNTMGVSRMSLATAAAALARFLSVGGSLANTAIGHQAVPRHLG